jgi:hypothetical protein
MKLEPQRRLTFNRVGQMREYYADPNAESLVVVLARLSATQRNGREGWSKPLLEGN